MTATAPTSAPAPVPMAPPAARWLGLSDWLNPIVVREVQQALKGRAFVLSVLAACIVVVAIALFVAGDFDPNSSGRNAFDAGLATLVPLVLFVVPMQAYQSMRHELRGGMVEQLLLSELRPRRIILGKLAAAMVQFVLYVSVLSPLLATSYLLRGVDMPAIGISLVFAALFCVAATAFAVSSAAQGVAPAMQGVANLAVAIALALSCMGFVSYIGSGQYARDIGSLLAGRYLGMVVSGLVLGGVASTTLSALTAATFLAHAYENKSSGFRLFLFILVGVAFGWVAVFAPAAMRDQIFVVATVALLIGSATFGLFMVTEQRDLSPRVRAHVPKRAAFALLAVPFLPGRDRGLLCFLLAAAVVLLLGWLTWPVGTSFLREPREFVWFLVSYSVIYLSIGRWLRSKLPASIQGNHLGRFALPFLLFLFCILPVLVDVFIQGGARRWHPGHAMNPFWTMRHFVFRDNGTEIRIALSLVAALLVLLQVPALVRAAREVLTASAVRRAAALERAAPPLDGGAGDGV
ncbi:MAG: hypothetical protein KDE27_07685 [Planctomycetes bacterium]|nr:hypothetical protein [Planctomycetota bacterium]